MRHFWLFWLICFLLASGPEAQASSFDLTGPKVDLRVKRGDLTLPIASVPNLLGGDRLWVHPDLPPTQAERFVLVVAFLRGITNPPPPEWFVRVETWTPSVRAEGVYVTVPNEAQQAVLFLVPETGGDFTTLKKAVRSEPGSFVRAVQDLQAASWDRMRVEDYLAQVKVTSQYDQKTLKERAELSARSLGIKINHDCFDKPTEQQAACLAQNPDSMVLDDSDAQSRVAQLTSGSTGDLMNAISSTSMAGSGAYSAYVGAVVDTAKILGSLHTAHFRYIPALALPAVDTLNLRLATPPSFRSPKSVVVIALPPMGAARLPALHPVNPADRFCVDKPGLVLPAEGAPLFYATDMAHDLTLHIETPGKNDSFDLPLSAEMGRGGLVLSKVPATLPEGELTGEVRGKWGFDDWKGPRFHLRAAGNGSWNVTSADQSALVVGRDDLLHLEGQDSLCLDRIEARDKTGAEIHVTWKSPKPETLELNVPLKAAAPGPITFSIHQFGRTKPQTLSITAFDDAAALDSISLNAGDTEVRLKGKRLDEVANASIEGVALKPGELSRVGEADQLTMTAENPFAKLVPGKHYAARVELRDGRVLKTQITVEPPRPQAVLLSKGVQQRSSQSVQMGSIEDLPLDGRLVFFLKSVVPAKFPRNQKVELAAADESFQTTLSLSDGSLILQDTHTVMGTLEPLARFGASAFGPIHARVVSANGTPGTWLPLGTLVRLPEFKELRCPRAVAKPCTLTGNNLFLTTAFSATQNFSETVEVPTGFTGTQIAVPHPSNGALYLKLRDDPATVQTLTMPIVPSTAADTLPPTPAAPSAAASEAPAAAPKPAAPVPAATTPAAPAPATETPKTATPEAKAATDAAEAPKASSAAPAAQLAPATTVPEKK